MWLIVAGESSDDLKHIGLESTDFGAKPCYSSWGKERIFHSQSGQDWAFRWLIRSQLFVTEGVAVKEMLMEFLHPSIFTQQFLFYLLD